MRKKAPFEKRERHIELPYGKGKISFHLPEGWGFKVLRPEPVSPSADPLKEVLRSLENPLGDKHLEDFGGATSVAIAISDETRPIPYHPILPSLLKKLHTMGIGPSAIQILIASGLHSPMPESRFSNLLPMEIIKEYSVLAHHANHSDLKFLGKTSRGTPVFVNPLFHNAELRLIVGMIDPHQFVGYTGGVKGAAIGLAGAETIEANHSLLFHPQALIGEIEQNPVRQDIEEIGKMMDVHFVIDVVLDESNRIIKAFSGDPWAVEKVGSEFCRTVYEIKVPKEYDVVIASPGGYPKDINLYQAQKALAHATPLVRQGGDTILMAECLDGHGSELFYQTIRKYRSPHEVVEDFQRNKFRMGVHKAFLWARSLIKAQVYLCSALDETMTHGLMVLPAKNIQEALERIEAKYVQPPRVALIPKASSTYVKLQA
jgi:nickel-dependent lactate racemase